MSVYKGPMIQHTLTSRSIQLASSFHRFTNFDATTATLCHLVIIVVAMGLREEIEGERKEERLKSVIKGRGGLAGVLNNR